MNRAKIKNLSKQQIKGNIGNYFLCGVVEILLLIAALIFGLGPTVLAYGFSMAFIIMSIKMARNIKIQINDLFLGFEHFGKVLWLLLLMNLFTFLWSLLFIIPGIIKGYSYQLAPYILYDHPEMTARQALNESKRLTQGYKGELFVLDLSFLGWIWLSSFTFGILMIWLAPYMATARANYYFEICRLKGMPQGNVNKTNYDNRNAYIPNNTPAPPAQNSEEQLTTPLYSEKEINSAVQKKNAAIVCLAGEYVGGEFEVRDNTELIIGRNASVCNIVLGSSNKEISLKHVSIKFNSNDNKYIVTDFSSNGTFVNGQRLTRNVPTKVNGGSIITLATDKVKFKLK